MGDVFEAKYNGGKGSKIQKISLMKESIHW